MDTLKISSRQNPQIKEAAKLGSKRFREESGLFLIEGYRELSRAILGGVRIKKLLICPPFFLGENEGKLIEQVGAQVLECSESVFEKLSYRDRPDGLIAVAEQMDTSLSNLEQKIGSHPLLIVAESIEKPGNLGSIMRSADGVGADGIIVCDRCTDIYNPNVVRASVGTLFTLPIVQAGGKETYDWLKAQNFTIVATSPAATEKFTDVDLTGPVAIVVGCEQLGLSDFWFSVSSCKVSIPMCGVADSLNVATATTLLLYEALRQRGARV